MKVSRSHWPGDLYWLMDGQKEHSCIMNTSPPGRSVTGLRLSPSSPRLLLLPPVLSRRAQLWATGNRLDSSPHFFCRVYAVAVTSVPSHRLFVCVCVCALMPLSGCLLYHTHTHKNHPQGGVERLGIWTDVDPSVECQCCHGGMTGLSLMSE